MTAAVATRTMRALAKTRPEPGLELVQRPVPVAGPGDVIATGTPAGVGHFHDPPRYLHHGDVLRCEIAGIGVLENRVVDELPRAQDHVTAAGVAELVELAR